MQPMLTRIRRPVEREGAEFYLLLLLLSFAASVSNLVTKPSISRMCCGAVCCCLSALC